MRVEILITYKKLKFLEQKGSGTHDLYINDLGTNFQWS